MPAQTDAPTPLPQKIYRAATCSLRLLPDFIIIGAQRGGTTSLYNYLAEHPGIGAASIKEVHFFDSPHFQQGLAWYRAHFPTVAEKFYAERLQKVKFITGEASPYYLFYPHAPARIARTLPGVKLIVMLRNPVDRAYSHYYHERAGGAEQISSFEEAIDCEEERLAGVAEKMREDERYYSFNHRHFSYLARGMYVDQLRSWMSLFSREQMLIIKSEDFYKDPAAIFKQCLAFLGLESLPPMGGNEISQGDRKGRPYNTIFKRYNETKPPRMSTTTRERLIEFFRPHNARLYEFLGRDFGWE